MKTKIFTNNQRCSYKPLRLRVLAFLVLALSPLGAFAKVDLVTLPQRERTQLTIYNSADLTLARDMRELTLNQGHNALQFSWAGTLIDPTSLELLPMEHAGEIDVASLLYPARTRNLGVWEIDSSLAGRARMEISYLTSGLSWRAFYRATLAPDESAMKLEGFVTVTNNSGEDYENAQVRVIVGKVNLLDQIATLARREYPYGRPDDGQMMAGAGYERDMALDEFRMEQEAMPAPMLAKSMMRAPAAPKEIRKEGLSEYFLYTIEGTETIPHGWSKRLPSFTTEAVPVVNRYKYEQERYGNAVMRFLSFKNDKEHKLGDTPIPGGMLRVFRQLDNKPDTGLAFEGSSSFQYIPVEEDVELSLGKVGNVIVDPVMMRYETDNYMFDRDGDIDGWDEIRNWEVTVKNARDIPVEIEILRNIGSTSWDIERSGDFGDFEKVDLDTVKFTHKLAAGEQRVFSYTVTRHYGRRAD